MGSLFPKKQLALNASFTVTTRELNNCNHRGYFNFISDDVHSSVGDYRIDLKGGYFVIFELGDMIGKREKISKCMKGAFEKDKLYRNCRYKRRQLIFVGLKQFEISINVGNSIMKMTEQQHELSWEKSSAIIKDIVEIIMRYEDELQKP